MKIQLHCGFIKIDIYRCQTLTLDNEDARATGCGMLQLECNLESSNSTTGSWNVLGQRRRKQTRQKTIAGRRRLIRYTQGVIEKKRKEKKRKRILQGHGEKNSLYALQHLFSLVHGEVSPGST